MSDPLPRLLAWYRQAWAAEIPTALHVGGVEWDRDSGGSLLGSPRWAPAFKRYLTGSAYEIEYAVYDNRNQTDPHYVRPLRTALAWMGHHGRPLMSRWLFLLGCLEGDWMRVGLQFEQPPEFAEAITREALFECQRAYRILPSEYAA